MAIEVGVGEEGRRRREWLWRVVRGCGGTSPIVVVGVRDEAALAEVVRAVEGMGVRVGGMRPPTVVGCRVRMSLGWVEGVGVEEVVAVVGRVMRRVEEVGGRGLSRL